MRRAPEVTGGTPEHVRGAPEYLRGYPDERRESIFCVHVSPFEQKGYVFG